MYHLLLAITLIAHPPTSGPSQDSLISYSLHRLDLPPVPAKQPEPRARMGLYLKPVETDSATAAGALGYRIWDVAPGLSADKAGIRPGDILITVEGKPLRDSLRQGEQYLSEVLRSKKPGDFLKATVRREGKEKSFRVKLISEPPIQMTCAEPPELGSVRADSWLAEALARNGLADSVRETLSQIAAVADMDAGNLPFTDRPNPWRLNAVTYLARHPLRTGAYSRLIVKDLWSTRQEGKADSTFPFPVPCSIDLPGVVMSAAKHLDLKAVTTAQAAPPEDLPQFDSLFTHVQANLDSAYKSVPMDLDSLSADLMRLLDPNDDWEEGLGAIRSGARQEEKSPRIERWLIKNLAAADHVRLEYVAASAAQVAVLADTSWIARFVESTPQNGRTIDTISGGGGECDGEIVRMWDSKWGRGVIGGRGPNRYRGDFLCVIDLGGDDAYQLPNIRPANCRIVIDLSGDDAYSGEAFGPASGVCGVDVLVDCSGDDVYRAEKYAQGAGLLGIGILDDWEGDDYYQSHWCSQGAAHLGIGILSDRSGNDTYISDVFSQGFGYSRGFGALMDAAGDDQYKAGWDVPDYRNPKRAHLAMSQGYGYGMRPWSVGVGTDGGIGVLTDLQGSDLYSSDFFCQGGSYWFGLGILHDGQGCDRYTAGQYSQGSGIHLAFAALLDDEGDDMYDAYAGDEQGNAHDWAAGCLEDWNGNDTYVAVGNEIANSQGCGLTVGVGWLLDSQGNDKYYVQPKDTANSQGGANFVTDRRSGGLGLLLDFGRGRDVYSDFRMRSGAEMVRGRVGILADDGE